MKKFLFIIVFFTFYLSVFSFVHLPEYNLDDFKPVKDNNVNIYQKFLKNISFYKKNFYFLKYLNLRKNVEADYDLKMIEITYKIGKHQIYQPVYLTQEQYLNSAFSEAYHKKLKQKFIDYLKQKNRTSNTGLLKDIVLKLPRNAVPRAVTKILGGDEAARLRLSGTQNITFSGKDTKTKNKSYNEAAQNRNFSLKMQQNLDLNLNGTIGKRIFVNVKHKTATKDQINPQNNDKVDIHYQGLDDDIVKFVKAGDLQAGFSKVGSSISTNGLFGVKADMQIGNLTLKTVIGKDKTQKNIKTFNSKSSTQKNTIQSRDFAKNYFYIDNPFDLYQIYTAADAPADFPEWANNAFKFNDYGQWIIKNPNLLPANNTQVHVFIDDDNANNDQFTVRGKNWSDPADTTTYHFDELTEGDDFLYDKNLGLLILSKTIQRQYTIGIIYTRADGVQIGTTEGYDQNNPDTYIQVKLIKKKNQDKDTDTWVYQCRNIYDLGMQGISPDGFEIKVFNRNSDGSENYYFNGINYIRFLHLDTNGDGKVNGDETTVDLNSGRIIIPLINPFYAVGDSIIYLKDNLTSNDETKMLISVTGKIQSDQINLNTFNLVKNSVVVKLNGRKLKPNIDYIVDYDLGVITLLNTEAMNSMDKITVEYEEIPLFSLENKTLIATQAELGNKDNDRFYLNGLLAFQSEKVKEERPKIGGENRSIFLAGVESGYKLEMPFLTKLVDKLPLINTDHMSKLNLASTFNLSIPHIYGSQKQPNKSEAYVEDMESSLESMGLGISRKLWVQASKPFNSNLHKSEVNWFVLPTWKAQDVFDNLTDDEKRESVPVMTVKVMPDTLMQDAYFGGLMKYLGNQVDLSRKDYIELMIKPEDVTGDVTVNIDLGAISEDFYTDFGGEGVLNTEDGKNGGAKNGVLDIGEDVGLDGIKNSDEEGYDSQDNKDPHHDNFDNKKVNNEYPHINRTEKNSTLDTEDLNSNGRLDTKNVYFEYSFPLSEISDWYIGDTHSGFKYFRIPMKAFTSIQTSSGEQPSLDKIEYTRIWFQVQDNAKFDIALFNIVGNKWQKYLLRNEETGELLTQHDIDPDEGIGIGTTDTQKDPHYVQPKQTKIKTNKKSLEQSVYMEINKLQNKHLALMGERVSADFSGTAFATGLDLTPYKKIRFLVYAENKEDTFKQNQKLHLYFRICYDSLTYYEIRYDSLEVHPYEANVENGIAKMKASFWKDFEVNFSDLTKLKADMMYSNGDSVIYKGKYRIKIAHKKNQWPNLNNIRMLMFGVAADEQDFTGRVYFDDIRVADVKENIGSKFTSKMVFNLADLADLTLDYNYESPDFLSNASRTTKVSNKKKHDFTISNKWYLGKLFPAEWGISLPLSISKEKIYEKNLYKENTDITIDNLPLNEKDKQVGRENNFSLGIDYTMNKTPRSKILEYTLKKSKLYFDYAKKRKNYPTTIDSSKTYTLKYIYDLDIPSDAIDIKLWKNYRFYFFPNKFNNTFTFNDNYQRKLKYVTQEDTVGWKVDETTYPTKTFDTDNTINYNMFSDLSFSYTLKTTRDLKIKNYFKKIPIGIEKIRNQTLSATYTPNYIDRILSLSLTPSATYHDDHKKFGTTDTLYYSGNVDRNIRIDVTLKNSDLFSSFANWLNSKFSKKKNSENTQEKQNNQNKKNSENKLKPEYKKYEKTDNKNIYENAKDWEKHLQKNETDRDKNKGWNQSKTQDDYKGYKGNKGHYNGGASYIETDNFLVKVLSYMSRLSNITLGYTDNYKSSYDRRAERPEFKYQIGLQGVIADSLLQRQEFSKNYDISTSIAIINGLSTTLKYENNYNETWTQTKNYTKTTTFPNITLAFSRIGEVFHIDKILESSNLNSSYLYKKELNGVINKNIPDKITKTYNFNPLVSWQANWKQGVTSTIQATYQYDVTTQNNSANQVVKYHYNRSISMNVGWSFSAPRGLDLPLLNRIHFKNELTPSLNVTINQEKEFNKSDKKHPQKWYLKINIKPKADYKFNKAITGTLSTEYNLNKDYRDNSSIRDFTLGISVRIEF